MALMPAEKKEIVAEVNRIAARAQSVILADYQGLTVAQMTLLRAQARARGVHLQVVKNTLARRALSGTDYQCLSDRLTGPLVLAFSEENVSAAAKLFKEFGLESDKLEVKAVAVDGKCMEVSAVQRLADLPGRDELLAMLMRAMKAPLAQLAGTLAAVPAKLVRVLAMIREQKEQSSK